jgi:hypothetical protein
MKHSHRLFLFFIVSLAVIVYGCSARPTEQIARTEKAMQQAQAEHADEFAPDDWRAAEQAWKDAQAKLDQQKYGDANLLLLRAKTRYEKARDLAKGKRADAIKEITNLQTTIDLRCKGLKSDLDTKGKKLTAKQKKDLKDTCKEVEEKLAKIATQLNQAQYHDAKFLAQTTLRQIWEGEKQLQDYLSGRKKS